MSQRINQFRCWLAQRFLILASLVAPARKRDWRSAVKNNEPVRYVVYLTLTPVGQNLSWSNEPTIHWGIRLNASELGELGEQVGTAGMNALKRYIAVVDGSTPPDA